jgi:hypothetical protein
MKKKEQKKKTNNNELKGKHKNNDSMESSPGIAAVIHDNYVIKNW